MGIIDTEIAHEECAVRIQGLEKALQSERQESNVVVLERNALRAEVAGLREQIAELKTMSQKKVKPELGS